MIQDLKIKTRYWVLQDTLEQLTADICLSEEKCAEYKNKLECIFAKVICSPKGLYFRRGETISLTLIGFMKYCLSTCSCKVLVQDSKVDDKAIMWAGKVLLTRLGVSKEQLYAYRNEAKKLIRLRYKKTKLLKRLFFVKHKVLGAIKVEYLSGRPLNASRALDLAFYQTAKRWFGSYGAAVDEALAKYGISYKDIRLDKNVFVRCGKQLEIWVLHAKECLGDTNFVYHGKLGSPALGSSRLRPDFVYPDRLEEVKLVAHSS